MQGSANLADDGASRTIAIGCFASLCRDRLAEPLVAFSAAYPDVGIGVHEMGYAELLPAVAARRLTLAIGPGGAADGFAGCDLWDDRAVVALRGDHALAAAAHVTLPMLHAEVLLVSRDRARAALHRFLVDRLFGERPPATRIVADARRCQMLDRVAAGEGIALLCESQVDAAMEHLVVRPVSDAAARFRVRAHWRAPPDVTLATLVGLLEASREI